MRLASCGVPGGAVEEAGWPGGCAPARARQLSSPRVPEISRRLILVQPSKLATGLVAAHLVNHDSRTTAAPRRRRRASAAAGVARCPRLPRCGCSPAPGGERGRSRRRRRRRAAGPALQAILDRAVRAPETTFPGVALYVRRTRAHELVGRRGQLGDRPRQSDATQRPLPCRQHHQAVGRRRDLAARRGGPVRPGRPAARRAASGRDRALRGAQIASPCACCSTTRAGSGEYNHAAFKREVLADPRRQWAASELLDRAAALWLRSGAPGERFAYSNANYNLLGLILEHATGKPWRAVIRERVIERLNLLQDLAARARRCPPPDGTSRTAMSLSTASSTTSPTSTPQWPAPPEATRCWTSNHDLSRFLRALLAGRLFQHPHTVNELRTFVPAVEPTGKMGYGLGLERYGLPGRCRDDRPHGHDGRLPGPHVPPARTAHRPRHGHQRARRSHTRAPARP